MKTNLITLTLISLLLSACASTPSDSTSSEANVTQSGTDQQTGNQATTTGTSENVATDTAALNTQEATQASIYFEMDQFTVAPQYQPVLRQQADRIKADNKTVTLEGNADERGSSEYNLALGNKRANSVRKSLEILGVPASQLTTISYGEEQPKSSCHEEKCWSENRRVDFKE